MIQLKYEGYCILWFASYVYYNCHHNDFARVKQTKNTTNNCRDAVFRVLAVEQPQAVVLNYAPGPLDTPMITELLEDQRTDPGRVIDDGIFWNGKVD